MGATYKVCILGACSVGKSSIAQRYVNNKFSEFNEPTIGAAFMKKTNQDITLEIWDTAGQERYHSLAPMYYRGAQAVLIVYDLSDLSTVKDAKKWILQVQHFTKKIPMILVGNKFDLVDNLVDKIQTDLPHFLVSAKTDKNIKKMFNYLITQVQEFQLSQQKKIDLNEIKPKKKKTNCC